MRCRALLAMTLLLAPTSASAQPPVRGWIAVNAGASGGPQALADTVQMPLYQETEIIRSSYPRGGSFVSGAAGYRVWKRLSIGIGISHVWREGEAAIDARLPHPLFDNQPRTITGTAAVSHDDTAVEIKAAWMAALSRRVRLLLSAGPTFVNVTQTLVAGVRYVESYPYDTAQFAGADTAEVAHTGTGVHAGADLFWLFSRHVGLGGTIQITHARVRLPANGREVTIDAGGLQGGGGIRFVF